MIPCVYIIQVPRFLEEGMLEELTEFGKHKAVHIEVCVCGRCVCDLRQKGHENGSQSSDEIYK